MFGDNTYPRKQKLTARTIRNVQQPRRGDVCLFSLETLGIFWGSPAVQFLLGGTNSQGVALQEKQGLLQRKIDRTLRGIEDLLVNMS